MITGGLLSVATVALALTGAEAFKGDFHSISKGLTTGSEHTKSTTKKSGHKKVSASIKCTSEGYAAAYADWKNSYISAVADVVADVCSKNFDGKTIKATQKMTGFAKAWARATAETAAECESKETGGAKASGCAYASASASAFEKAFASAHAEASAEAFAKFCKKNCADAEAWSFGDAKLFEELVADAYAAAESTVCASGNQISTASASVDCQAHIFAQTFAFAAAEASVKGRCYGKSGNAKARTAIEAEVDAQIYDDSVCVTEEKKTGLSANKTKGRSSAKSRSVHKGKGKKGRGRK